MSIFGGELHTGGEKEPYLKQTMCWNLPSGELRVYKDWLGISGMAWRPIIKWIVAQKDLILIALSVRARGRRLEFSHTERKYKGREAEGEENWARSKRLQKIPIKDEPKAWGMKQAGRNMFVQFECIDTGTRVRWEGKGKEIEPKTTSVSTTEKCNHYWNVVFLLFENVWVLGFSPQEFLSVFLY